MKRTTTYVAGIATLLLWATPLHADYSTGGGFSAPGYGARAWGMGGAAIATVGDESAAFWNPAMLSLLDHRNRIGLSYYNLVPGTDATQSYAAYAHVFKEGPLDEPHLRFAKHAAAAILGNLSLKASSGEGYTENTLRLSYAYSPEYFVSIGVSFTALLSTSDLEAFGSKGTAIDAGLRLKLSRNLTVAAVVRNAFSRLDFDDGAQFALPRSLTVGVARTFFEKLTIEGDAVASHGGVSRLALGGEYIGFAGLLSLRAGAAAMLAGESRSIPYFGMGIKVIRIRLDYNANLDTEDALSDTHRVSLGIGL